jgi:transposase
MPSTRRIQDFILKGKEIFVGLEDSKKTWKLAVRHDRRVIHQVSMEARIPVLMSYLTNRFPDCTVHLIYEAGFKGFNLYDSLTEEGIDCVVIPPHLVTEEELSRAVQDRQEGREPSRLCPRAGTCGRYATFPTRNVIEDDRQISRTLTADRQGHRPRP